MSIDSLFRKFVSPTPLSSPICLMLLPTYHMDVYIRTQSFRRRHHDDSPLTLSIILQPDSCIFHFTMQLRLHAPVLLATLAVGIRALLASAFSPIQPLVPTVSSSRSCCRSRQLMFTGIVEEMGVVVSLEERDDMMLWDGSQGKGTELVVQGNVVMEGAYLG
jgi:hypothetical protein